MPFQATATQEKERRTEFLFRSVMVKKPAALMRDSKGGCLALVGECALASLCLFHDNSYGNTNCRPRVAMWAAAKLRGGKVANKHAVATAKIQEIAT